MLIIEIGVLKFCLKFCKFFKFGGVGIGIFFFNFFGLVVIVFKIINFLFLVGDFFKFFNIKL